MKRLLHDVVRVLLRILTNQEKTMSDLSRLNQSLADLAAKVDALIAKQNPPPADDQPAIDQAVAAVEAIAAKIPA